jgi:predicted TIM-barrel fold metal-dependent hydrolase
MNEWPYAGIGNFCAHEHWGSMSAFGPATEGFRADVEQGATPLRPVALSDVVLDPYMSGNIAGTGPWPDAIAQGHNRASFHEWAKDNPRDAWGALRAPLSNLQMTGTWQCLRRGIMLLHNADIAGLIHGDASSRASLATRLDATLAQAYSDTFGWYRKAMGQLEFTGLVRPVHPLWYIKAAATETVEAEKRFTHTVMRIDPLLKFWQEDCSARDALVKETGIEPRDAESWRAFLARLFSIAKAGGAVGIKQLQAYSRDLDFNDCAEADAAYRGPKDDARIRAFQNWVVQACCEEAERRAWPHQIHVGTHNITACTPMPLEPLAKRYPGMKLVLIHCWPFLNECGWLARHLPNVYLDSCWLPVLNPDYFRSALETWTGYVPIHKISCSHDSTSIEMAAGSAWHTRTILQSVLNRATEAAGCDAEMLAAAYLGTNAEEIYRVRPVAK